ncbi:MAG: cyclic-di-AMP receptor [Clostridium baratii]|uniref:cyclic-di-AMP receptor n=1 Tax=Clostridium baratii TaxID=1561 RepID=UPI0024319749|nr:cyclic-di-AMP receptor [Clostridium baratii]MBS6042246.1 cyclic-di-AMP receptor [Clostridium baratii]
MKLLIAVVHDDDSEDLLDALAEKEIGVTKLATTGGFLKAGNTTLMIGVRKEQVDEVANIIKDVCKERKEVITTPAPITGNNGMYMQYPIEVQVGGATIFVVDVDQFIKI